MRENNIEIDTPINRFEMIQAATASLQIVREQDPSARFSVLRSVSLEGYRSSPGSSLTRQSSTGGHRASDDIESTKRRQLLLNEDFIIDRSKICNFDTIRKSMDLGDIYIVTYTCGIRQSRNVLMRKTKENEIVLILERGLRVSNMNIIPFFGYVNVGIDQYFLVMEKPVNNLQSLLERPDTYISHNISLREEKHKTKVALGLAQGMAYLHDKLQIVHFNLHPHRVMLCIPFEAGTFEVKITDFSQSKFIDSNRSYDTHISCYCKTDAKCCYLPPELRPVKDTESAVDINAEIVHEKPATADEIKAADVYTYGVVLAQLYIESVDGQAALEKIDSEGQNHSDPPWLFDFVYRCTKFNKRGDPNPPCERPQAAEMLQELEKAQMVYSRN